MGKDRFYLNTSTGEVAEGKRPALHLRMGPYATREEAESAYLLAQERTAALDAADEEEREAELEWGVPPAYSSSDEPSAPSS